MPIPSCESLQDNNAINICRSYSNLLYYLKLYPMDIEVFKLMIYSYGFDAETIHKQCFPSFRQQVLEQYGIEPSPFVFTQWLIELKDRITSFQIVADDDATVSELIFLLKADDLMKEKNLSLKEAG